MDAPGATEAMDDIRQDGSDLEVSAGRNVLESNTHPNHLDPLAGNDHEHDDDKDEDQDDNEHGDDSEEEDEEEAEDDEDEEEPHLKYAYLTKHLGAVYRNGDATSSFLAAGDKMV